MCEERYVRFSLFIYLCLFWFVDVESLDLLFMTKGYVVGMIDELSQYPEYTTLLMQTADEEQKPPAKRTRAATDEASKKIDRSALIPEQDPSKKHIKGKKPPQFMNWIGKGSVTADLFNLSDMKQVMRLETYLMENGSWELFPTPKNGQCLFASVRRGLQIPEEYRSNHLRFQLAHFMCKNHKVAFDVIEEPVKIQYGHSKLTQEEYLKKTEDGTITPAEIEDFSLPGPFSFQSFLKYLIEPTTWGDQTTLLLISMMWQLPITILNGEELNQIPIRHDKEINDVELLLVFVGRSHFLGTCKYIHIFSVCARNGLFSARIASNVRGPVFIVRGKVFR